jgi:flagellar biosynthesis protein FlhF
MNATAPLIRTFRARDARSALSAVKAAFGLDAVILETKQVSGGLFGKPQIEVTAASSGPEPAPSPSRPAKPDRAMETDVAALRRVMEDVRRTLHQRGREDGGRGPERSLDGELTADARRAFRHLLDWGLDESQARRLLDDAQDAGAERASEILQSAGAALGRQLGAAPAPWTAESRRTIALVGPTGVGKTTAVAKIAARALLETQFKVGLITVDTYRVGASDQLSRYGKIMGVPTYVARDRAGLADAVARTRDCDLVIIDTAGRSDDASIEAQMDLLRTAPNVQLHLVMSLATGGREMAAVARRYKPFAPERLIFTKLDESEAPAGALAATAQLARPVSCLCDGQRVPEDIHPVTDEDLLARLVGIGANGTAKANNKEQIRGSGR